MKAYPALLLAACLAIVTGCKKMEVTKETFVNEKDPKQVLKLESVPSLKIALLGPAHNTEAVGHYTLETDSGTITGTYAYTVDSKKFREYSFKPENGERWTGKLDNRGSFTDDKGTLWRIQKVQIETLVDAKESKVLTKVGG